MTLLPYFADISEELRRQSERMRRDFATHRPSAGDNRESIVAEFLRAYLPKTFGIDTGLVLARTGQFSNQADLLVVDQTWNAPLYPTNPNRIWLAESVFALLEVKTYLTPTEIGDAVAKCRRFKALPRGFDELPTPPRNPESLFVLWGFEAPAAETLLANLSAAVAEVPQRERPDLVIVPGHVVVSCGLYQEIATIGMPGSTYRRQLEDEHGVGNVPFRPMVMIESEHSLLMWLIWFESWLKSAGNRSAPLQSYLPESIPLGRQLF